MKKQLLNLTIILLSTCVFGQQGDGGTPKSAKISVNQKLIDHKLFSTPDISALRAEDVINDEAGTGPWRFGFNNYTSLNMTNSGTWTSMSNGDKIWMLELTCEEALTVNLTFNNVVIPEGNELYVYNPVKDFILGKFTAYHLYEGELGTELIPGNTVIVEYYVPAKNAELAASLNINTVTHGYRTANEFMLKAFGGSGSCNLNANCPEGAAWINERNSVVMLVSGSSGFCSGSLINNTLNDGKPYVLTADHCYSNPASWIFRFNWQSTGCANPASSPTFQSLSGAVLRARAAASDFCLVEITGGLVGNTVPAAYGPYFPGWDKTGVTPTSAVGIHHPSGDIKKISFENQPLISTSFGGSPANSHWGVTSWDLGVTEGGSSGSPLFDQNHRIIGQLHGGASFCGASSLSDEYGKVSYSWNPAGSNSTNQLQIWLDPNTSGAAFVDGYDPSGAPAVALDAGINNPQGVSGTFCSATVTPQITISNSGTNVLTSATINYGFNGVLNQTYPWTGSLNQYQTAVVTLPSSTLAGGTYSFDAVVVSPNGALDENAANNTITSSFVTVVNGQIASLALNLDCWATETTWELTNATNVVLYSGSGYTDGNPILVEQDFCLSFGCYNFIILDEYGDGLTSCSAAQGGDGSYSITYNGTIMAEIAVANANFGSTDTQNFCIQDNSGLGELDLANNVLIYPNPAKESVEVVSNGFTIQKVELMNIAGQIISTINSNETIVKMNISTLSSGVYLVKVYASEGTTTKQLVIK
jgi:hypothetical protein